MKIRKRLTEWKTWLFFILPCLMFLAFFVILIYAVATKSNHAPLIISAEVLLAVGGVLLSCTGICARLKSKSYARGIMAIFFIVCFLALQSSAIALLPKFVRYDEERESLYAQWQEVPLENRDEYWEKYDAYRKLSDEQSDTRFALEFLNIGGVVALSLAGVCLAGVRAGYPKKEAPKEN